MYLLAQPFFNILVLVDIVNYKENNGIPMGEIVNYRENNGIPTVTNLPYNTSPLPLH